MSRDTTPMSAPPPDPAGLLERLLDEAEAEIKARLKEADLAARATVVKVREEFEASTKKRRAELDKINSVPHPAEFGLYYDL